MTLEIKNKRSAALNSAPAPEQLTEGEIGINYNADSLALYVKDTNGDVRKIAGSGSEGFYWDLSGSTLSPAENTYDVSIGGGNIELKSSGSITAAGSINAGNYDSSSATNKGAKLSDNGTLFAQRPEPNGLVFAALNGAYESTDDYSIQITANGSIQADGDVKIGGTSSDPNIELEGSDGKGKFAGRVLSNDSFQIWAPTNSTPIRVTTSASGSSGSNVFAVSSAGAITAASTIRTGGNPNEGAEAGSKMLAQGVIQVARNTGNPTLQSFKTGTTTPTFEVTAAGGITAASDVKIGGSALDPNIELKSSDGSITAAGTVQIADGASFNSSTTTGSSLFASGQAVFCRDVVGAPIKIGLGVTEPISGSNVSYLGIADSISAGTADIKIKLFNNGSITAAGDVKIGGSALDPNIELKSSDGSITADGNGNFGDFSNAAGTRVSSNGSVISRRNVGGTLLQAAIGNIINSNEYAFSIHPVGQYTGTALKNVIDWDGSIKIGGLIESAPNIELKASNGSAAFVGPVNVTRSEDTSPCFNVFKTGKTNPTVSIYAGGSALFTGDVRIGGTYSDPKTTLIADGSATFAGAVTAAGQIESKADGFKFPDGTVQTTAASGGGGGSSVDSVTGGTNINVGGTAEDPVVNLDDSIALTGKATSDATVAGDPDETLTTKGYVDSLTPGGGGRLTGEVIAFAGATVPADWQECDGSEAATQALKDVLGVDNVPNLRGQFVRGWDNGAGVDPGRLLLSDQLDQMQRITGRLSAADGRGFGSNGQGAFTMTTGSNYPESGGTSGARRNANFDSGNSPDARVSADTTGETRPVNVALMYIIKT